MGQFEKTLYEDPVGALADVSTVAGGAGLVAKGATVAAKAGGLAKVAAAVGRAGKVAGKVSEFTDPIQVAVKAAPKSITIIPAFRNKNPVKADAAAWGLQQGIPVDAGTATGNPFVKGAQELIDQSTLGGAFVSPAEKALQADAMVTAGQTLAGRSNAKFGLGPTVVPETAGAGVKATLEKKIAGYKHTADEAYDKFREMESGYTTEIPAPEKPKVMPKYPGVHPLVEPEVDAAINARLSAIEDHYLSGLGDLSGKGKVIDKAGMNADAVKNLKQSDTGYGRVRVKSMFPEMAGLHPDPKEIGRAIQKGSGELYSKVRKRVQDQVIDEFGDTINVYNEQAEKYAAALEREAKPTIQIPLSVDMRGIKAQLQPIYERMTQWMEPAKRNASAGYQAVKSVLEGKDYVQASIAEEGLSGLKQLAREAKSPDMANVSQGLGKFSARALQEQIDSVVGAANPEMLKQLHKGRSAHLAKMGVDEIAKQLRAEPVQTYRLLTYQGDSGVGLLRKVAKLAPADMPKLGRALLEDILDTATAEGNSPKPIRSGRAGTNSGIQQRKYSTSILGCGRIWITSSNWQRTWARS